MNHTPFARGKNFSLESLKIYLDLYKVEYSNLTKREVEQLIEKDLSGYTKTYYQNMSQFGLEYKESPDGVFWYQDYLKNMSDNELNKYIQFWFMTYYSPNYRVTGDDNPQLIYVSILEKLLISEDYSINFDVFKENFLEHGSKDILENLLISYGKYIDYKKNDNLSLIKEDIQKAKDLINYIKTEFPIPKTYKSGICFYNRYSKDNFLKFVNFLDSKTENINSLEKEFENWLKNIYIQKDGNNLSLNSQKKYLSYLNIIIPKILSDNLKENIKIFEISNSNLIDKYYQFFKKDLKELDSKTGNAYSAALNRYSEFLVSKTITFSPIQEIVYGAPGTGKSFYISQEIEGLEENTERVTFYDGYSHNNFVGAY
ncbi:MAG: hypothetical protein ACRC6U_11040, partial [Fusobacteriaceae bacterium]